MHFQILSNSVVSIKIFISRSESFSHCLWCFNIQRFSLRSICDVQKLRSGSQHINRVATKYNFSVLRAILGTLPGTRICDANTVVCSVTVKYFFDVKIPQLEVFVFIFCV